ncbi:MAG: serine/threonine protein kinase [Cytophagia bacterium]|nr:serine/threonine protein kinase [Cytophagia bacterium]NBW37478.1 serine/threonine protein kinase [Cytophagia bacterium]
MTIESLKGPQDDKQYINLQFHKRGGMGEIYLCHDIVNDRQVAIKLIAIDNPSEAKLLQAEIDISLALKHDNIIKTHYASTSTMNAVDFYYQVMDFHQNGNLRSVLTSTSENIPLADCYKIMTDLANGLQHAHQKIIHRDLKPENILLGNDGRYKICDFGLAKYVDNKTRTQTFKGSGTYPYMAPECWTFDSNTISMDLYALGIIFFELLTKRLPFTGKNESEIKEKHLFEQLPNLLDFRGGIPIKVVQMIGKMTNKRPADRYNSVNEIINVLESVSNEVIETPKTNEKLLQLANKKIADQQREQLEGQRKITELQTKERLLDHSTELLFQKFTDKVNELNNQLEQAKIVVQRGKRKLSISFQSKSIQFYFFPEADIQQQIDRRVRAAKDFQIQKYGFLVQEVEKTYLEKDNVMLIGKAEIGGGFSRERWGYNLILKRAGQDDLYGEWSVAWFNDSPLFAGQHFEHYPIDIPEFYQEYEFGRGNVIHVRSMVYKFLTDEVIDSTLEKILS